MNFFELRLTGTFCTEHRLVMLLLKKNVCVVTSEIPCFNVMIVAQDFVGILSFF